MVWHTEKERESGIRARISNNQLHGSQLVPVAFLHRLEEPFHRSAVAFRLNVIDSSVLEHRLDVQTCYNREMDLHDGKSLDCRIFLDEPNEVLDVRDAFDSELFQPWKAQRVRFGFGRRDAKMIQVHQFQQRPVEPLH